MENKLTTQTRPPFVHYKTDPMSKSLNSTNWLVHLPSPAKHPLLQKKKKGTKKQDIPEHSLDFFFFFNYTFPFYNLGKLLFIFFLRR